MTVQGSNWIIYRWLFIKFPVNKMRFKATKMLFPSPPLCDGCNFPGGIIFIYVGFIKQLLLGGANTNRITCALKINAQNRWSEYCYVVSFWLVMWRWKKNYTIDECSKEFNVKSMCTHWRFEINSKFGI